MALIIDAVPTSATMNCFCTLAEAESYHEARLHNDTWLAATTADKNAALVWATRQLCTLKWRGTRTVSSQPLEHPRAGLSYSENGSTDYYGVDTSETSYLYGIVTIDSATVCRAVKDATAELALWLLSSDTTANSGTEGFKRIKVDTIELEVNANDRPSWFESGVRNLVWRFLANISKFSVSAQRVG